MPNGEIQSEFRDTLARAGAWLQQYGESIYGTRGKIIAPQPWGVVTGKETQLYVHLMQPTGQPYVFIPSIAKKVSKATLLNTARTLRVKQQPEGVFVFLDNVTYDPINTVIRLETN